MDLILIPNLKYDFVPCEGLLCQQIFITSKGNENEEQAPVIYGNLKKTREQDGRMRAQIWFHFLKMKPKMPAM
jgi:hypothetical protein